MIFADIYCIRARNNYVGIYNGDQQIFFYQTLKEMNESLTVDKFMRVDKSCIVSLDKIAETDNTMIILKNQQRLPVSAGYKASLDKMAKG